MPSPTDSDIKNVRDGPIPVTNGPAKRPCPFTGGSVSNGPTHLWRTDRLVALHEGLFGTTILVGLERIICSKLQISTYL
jgi:hypothetical protein